MIKMCSFEIAWPTLLLYNIFVRDLIIWTQTRLTD